MKYKHFWEACLERLKDDIPPAQFDQWIKDLMLGSVKEDKISIFAPNYNKARTVKKLYGNNFTTFANQYFDRKMRVEVIPSEKGDSNKSEGKHEEVQEEIEIVVQSESSTKTGLQPELVFENFVIGQSNQMAHMAAQHVVQQPGNAFNPLCIVGDVGLGKTHLVQSIGNALLTQNPKLNILYTHAEQFINDVVKSYRNSNIEGLRLKYQSLDVLLIDDIQFFVGKERSQEFFFYTFEALAAANKQIVLTCEVYPQEVSKKVSKEETKLDDRLVSRFSSGVTMVIGAPEVEMRVAILQKKIDLENQRIELENKKNSEKKRFFVLPDDAAFFIAQSFRSNIRELEGALRTFIAHAIFHNQPLSLALAKEALKDMVALQNRQISVDYIQKTVADYYRIKVSDMLSKKRPANIARPRQIAMYLTKELTQKSLPEIGQLFGGKDHTTVLHAVKKITKERMTNEDLERDIHMFEQTLRN